MDFTLLWNAFKRETKGELPQVMSLESASIEDYKFENEKKSEGMALERSELTRPL